jgi:UDP-N-acetylglucosamine acyltransferase
VNIHASAVVSPHAEIGPDVMIGPYSSIGDYVTIGQGTDIGAHVVIEGHTHIGERNKIYHFSSLGTPPQDVGYRGEETRLMIGNDNVIREYTSINRATTKENWKTVINNNNYIMAYAHIAHDCVLGDGIIMSNAATLGGHISIGDNAIIGGLAAVHQFVRIGAHAFVGGMTGVDKDVPPFLMASGARAKLYGVNQKGLVRSGFSRETIDGLKRAYRIIWRGNRKVDEGIEEVKRDIGLFPELEMLLDFLDGSKRGILR